jgi:hypothetical protein
MENNSEEKEMKKRLGQMLLEAGYIDELQLAVALGRQKEQGSPLGTHLVKLGFVAERTLSEILKKQLGIQWVTLFDRKISEDAIKSIPIDIAVKYTVMPLAYHGKTITIAITNPSDLEQIDSLSFQLGKKIKPYMALESDIKKAIAKHYQAEEHKRSEMIGNRKDILNEQTQEKGQAVLPSDENVFDFYASRSTGSPVSPAPSSGIKTGQSFSTGKNPPLYQALINLLIRKKLITKEELFDEFMHAEQPSSHEK